MWSHMNPFSPTYYLLFEVIDPFLFAVNHFSLNLDHEWSMSGPTILVSGPSELTIIAKVQLTNQGTPAGL